MESSEGESPNLLEAKEKRGGAFVFAPSWDTSLEKACVRHRFFHFKRP